MLAAPDVRDSCRAGVPLRRHRSRREHGGRECSGRPRLRARRLADCGGEAAVETARAAAAATAASTAGTPAADHRTGGHRAAPASRQRPRHLRRDGAPDRRPWRRIVDRASARTRRVADRHRSRPRRPRPGRERQRRDGSRARARRRAAAREAAAESSRRRGDPDPAHRRLHCRCRSGRRSPTAKAPISSCRFTPTPAPAARRAASRPTS